MSVGRPTSSFAGILRSSAKAGAASVAGLLAWLVGGKILALVLGAAGVGLFGLVRQLLQYLALLSTFNGETALVQGLASREGAERHGYARAVARVFAAGGATVAVVLLAGAPWLGPWLLPHPDSVALVRWLSLAVLATTARGFFVGVLNGHRRIDAVLRCQLLGVVTVLLVAWPAAALVRRGQPGGLVLLLLAPAAVIGLAAALVARRSGALAPPGRPVELRHAASFLRVSGVMFVVALLGNGAQFLQSRLVAGTLGLEQAGHYWAAWTLSAAYVSILLGSYGLHYLPALSGLTDPAARRILIRDYLRVALLVMPPIVSLVVLLKPWVIRAAFSAELLPALAVMRWMLLGDLFKVMTWVLALPMQAFAQLRWIFWSEVIFAALQTGATAAWLSLGGGIEGLGVLFLALYALDALFMWAYAHLQHHVAPSARELLEFLGGLALVVTMSAITWDDVNVRALPALVFMALSLAFLVVFARRPPRPGGGEASG